MIVVYGGFMWPALELNETTTFRCEEPRNIAVSVIFQRFAIFTNPNVFEIAASSGPVFVCKMLTKD